MLTYVSWGKKTFRKYEGIAADFCGICRRPTGVEIEQVRLQNHVNHIGFGQGELVGRICHCKKCGSEWAMQPGTIADVVNPTGPMTLSSLIAETYPSLRVVNAARLEQEAIIENDPLALPRNTRANLVAEPFYILDNDFLRDESHNQSGTNFVTGLGCLISIGMVVAGIVNFIISGFFAGAIMLAIGIGLSYGVLKVMAFYSRRYMKTRIYPRLASCLAPMRPSSEELSAVIEHLKPQSKCAARIKLDDFTPILDGAVANAKQVPIAVDR